MIKTHRKVRTGVVISDKMEKTIVVRVTRLAKHPRYNKIIKKIKKFKVHDAKNTARVGDAVVIQETRPLSKDKRWRLVQVTKKTEPDLAPQSEEKE